MTAVIDFDTMRVNCIQIHQEVFELLIVAKHIGEELNLIVKDADELRNNPETKTWDGMGRYAKTLYDDTAMWDILPETLNIRIDVSYDGQKKLWNKKEARAELLNCYQSLGGKNLY